MDSDLVLPTVLTVAVLTSGLWVSGCDCLSHTRSLDGGTAIDAIGPVDAPIDAPDVDAMFDTCFDSLVAGRTGDTCAVDDNFCVAYDACCSYAAHCYADGLLNVAEEWACIDAFVTSCASDEPTAVVSGRTPLGPALFEYAFGSHSHAFSVDMQLMFVSSSPLRTCDAVRMGVWLTPGTSPGAFPPTYVGEHRRVLTLNRGGERAMAEALIVITDMGADGSSPTGTIEVTTEGWDLRGTFAAPECDDLDRSGP